MRFSRTKAFIAIDLDTEMCFWLMMMANNCVNTSGNYLFPEPGNWCSVLNLEEDLMEGKLLLLTSILKPAWRPVD